MRKVNFFALGIIVILAMGTFTGCTTEKMTDVKQDSNVKDDVDIAYQISEKFSDSDLVVDNLKYGMTEDEVKSLKGNPDKVEEGESESIYGSSIIYFYGDLELVFYNYDGEMLLGSAATKSKSYVFTRGLKVGDSKEKVLNSFYRDSKDESELRDIYATFDPSKSYGKYLYGRGIDDVADAVEESGIVQYACINYYGYDSSKSDSTYMIEYKYAKPPYLSDYASIADMKTILVFDVDNKGIVTCIRWYYYPEME